MIGRDSRAARYSLAYFAVGILWIYFTDSLLKWFVSSADLSHFLQSVKGLFFVGCTALGLYLLIRAYLDLVDRTEKSASSQLERYHSQFDHAPMPGYVWQKTGDDFVLIDFNRAARSVVGGSLENVLGARASEFYGRNDGVLQELSRCFSERLTFQKEMSYWFRTTDKDAELRLSYAFVPPDLVMVYTEDVSERVGAQREVARSEQQFRQIYNHSPDIIFSVDPEGRFTSINAAFERLSGWTPEEWIGRSVFELLDEASRAPALEVFKAKVGGTDNFDSNEYSLRNASGESRTFEVRTSVLRAHDGGIVGLTGFARDLTAQKDAEARLRDAEMQFRAFMHHFPSAAWMKDEDLRHVFVNSHWESDLGLRRENALGKNDLELFGKEKGEVYEAGDREMLSRNMVVETTDIGPPGGRGGRFLVLKFPIQLGTRRFVGGMAIDVTEREREHQEIEAQREFLRAVLDTMAEGIIATDAAGVISLYNRTLIGWQNRVPDPTLLPADWPAVFGIYDAPNEKMLTPSEVPLARALRGEQFRDAAITIRAGGRVRSVLASGKPVIVEEGRQIGAVVVLRDVSEELQMRANLEQHSRLSSLGKLAASIAHEFNNVLMGIQPFAEVIARRAGEDARLSSAAAAIRESVRRGKTITADVLRFARPAELTIQSVDVRIWFAAMDIQLRTLLPPNVRLQTTLPEEPITIAIDRPQLEQVITNLVLNAKDAMPDGGTIFFTARPRASELPASCDVPVEHRDDAVITVRDTGRGIPADVLPHIFEPLYTTKRSGGTGLGLAISHSLVLRHRGLLLVETAENSGTSFHLLTPRAGVVAIEAVALKVEPSTASRRVLVVEDDANVGAGLFAMLSAANHDVTLVERGNDAIEMVSSFQPEVVVLDVRLPDIDGTEVFRLLRLTHPTLPVIFSTGHADEREIAHLLVQGPVKYLLKPYESDVLLRMIGELTED